MIKGSSDITLTYIWKYMSNILFVKKWLHMNFRENVSDDIFTEDDNKRSPVIINPVVS